MLMNIEQWMVFVVHTCYAEAAKKGVSIRLVKSAASCSGVEILF
jgi:hypothetical protein